MASVKYFMKNNPSIYVRFSNGRMFDVTASTNISVDPKYWDNRYQKIKNVIAIPNRDKINEKLALLKLYVVNQFNESYILGETIDKQWLDTTIKIFFKRPEKEGIEGKHFVYLSDFSKWWLEQKSGKYKVSSNKYMDEATKKQYEQAIENLIEFEGRTKVRLKDTDTLFFDQFSSFLTNDMDYAHATAKRKIGRIKFFCARAEQENVKVHKGYKSIVYIEKKEVDYKHPYLNEDEIKKVFEYTSEKSHLNITRDNWIIGLWTGLRVSDFLTRLDMSNIDGDFLEIRTKKTKTSVAIPLHWQVKEVLKRYNGNLPPKINEQDFNDYIKDIAKELKFNDIMLGGIPKKENDRIRKKIDKYPKWMLITSHICRRSFCTNLFGKVPNQVIMDIAGWSNEKQMYSYNKSTNRESAIKLKKHWELNKLQS
jgi:integrase